MAGTLYLIPNTLGLRDADDPLPEVIPAGVQQITARLDYLSPSTPRRRAPC